MLGTWLPLAFADILRAICGPSVATADVLRRWGLESMANEMQTAQTDAALNALAGMMTRQETT